MTLGELDDLPLGGVIEPFITSHDLADRGETPIDEPAARIEESRYLTSYNWVGEAKIIVSGEPPKWDPPANHVTCPQDCGYYDCDETAARYPSYPLEPMVRAILKDHPRYPLAQVDIVICEDTMCKLLDFARGYNPSFKVHVEVLDRTVFFTRREDEHNAKRWSAEVWDHEMPKRYNTWDASVAESESHYRVMEYKFGGLRCLLRCSIDGFQPDCDEPTGVIGKTTRAKGLQQTEADPAAVIQRSLPHKTEVAALSQGHTNSEQALSSLEAQVASSLQITTVSAPKPLVIIGEGRHIPQASVFNMLLQSCGKRYGKRKVSLDKGIKGVEEALPRSWVTQVPTLKAVFHRSGKFKFDYDVDVRDQVARWEDAEQKSLAKFARLLRMISAYAQGSGMTRFELSREQDLRDNGTCFMRLRTPDVDRVLPLELAGKWEPKLYPW